jgi:hypothetical protein
MTSLIGHRPDTNTTPGKEIAVLSIELLARDVRATSLRQAERRNRLAQLTSQRAQHGRTGPSGARRAIGNYLVSLGTAIAGPTPDGLSPRPMDRPA